MYFRFRALQLIAIEVHGYSMLRTTLNQDYFNSLFDLSLRMGVEIEGHRTCCLHNFQWRLNIQLFFEDTETGPGELLDSSPGVRLSTVV